MDKNILLKSKTDKKLLSISGKSKINYFGRANSAIWCIASYLKSKSIIKTVILPSTMCISPAIIFKLHGFNLKFVDVNENDGLINVNKSFKFIERNKDTSVLFYVNLFGNKDKNIDKIKNFKDLFIIQDFAQTFFHKKKISKKDIFGDMIILSFGYSKIFDLDHGGIVLSDKKEFYEYGVNFDKKIVNKKISLSAKKLYLNWYSKVIEKRKKLQEKNLKSFASKIYLIKFNNKKIKDIYNSIKFIDKEYYQRKIKLRFYKKLFQKLKVKILHSNEFFIPWRFSFLISNRDKFLKIIRKKGYDASSYYPNIARVFNKKKEKFKNSDIIEKKVINLWLTKNYNLKKIKAQFDLLKNNL